MDAVCGNRASTLCFSNRFRRTAFIKFKTKNGPIIGYFDLRNPLKGEKSINGCNVHHVSHHIIFSILQCKNPF